MSTKQQKIDSALLDFVGALQARIVTAAESGRPKVDLDGLDGDLRALDSRLADVAMGAAAMVAAGHAANLANHRGPVGSLLASAQIENVIAAVGEARTDNGKRETLDQARSTVAEIAEGHSVALRELEHAVSRADIDAVLRLRPEVEVSIPARLDAARLAVLDAEIALVDEITGHCESAETAATSHLAAAEKTLDEARAALAAAETNHQTKTRTLSSAGLARTQVEMRLAELRTQRSKAAATLEQSAHARYRRLAGLPDETPTQVSAAGAPLGQTPPVVPLVRSTVRPEVDTTPVTAPTKVIDPFARRSTVLSQAGGF